MNIFNHVKNKISILTVVQEYCSLKKTGGYWKGSCPFHHERTASFTVSPQREIFYCFGCHQGGDVISFIANLERCSQREAVQFLIERYGLDVPETLLQKHVYQPSTKRKHYELCALIAQWCSNQLALNKDAQAYLKDRSVNAVSIKNFMLGYFPPHGIKGLSEYLKEHAVLLQDLEETAFILSGKHGLYSPFEDRIIFPIMDHMNRIVAFGGRIFRATDQRPKYYNSHENAFFNKGSLLYGMCEAKKNLKDGAPAFLVEGYMDCIMMHQGGYSSTVATLGTACTLEHLVTLGRYSDRLFTLYDGDNAGKQAILRLARLCWQSSLELSVVTLPTGDDPASYLIKYQTLAPLVDKAQDIFLYFIQSKELDFHKKSMQERLESIDECIDLIHEIEDPLKKNMLLQKASSLFALPLDSLMNRLAHKKRVSRPFLTPTHLSSTDTPEKTISGLEKKLFSAIIKSHSTLALEDEQFLESHLPPLLVTLYNRFKQFCKQENSDLSSFISELSDSDRRIVSALLIADEEESGSFEELFAQFQKKQWKLMVNDVKMELARAQTTLQQAALQEKIVQLQVLQKKLLKRGLI